MTDHTLLSTDDAMVWAEEFCRIFKGAIIGTPQGNVSGAQVYIDEGLMVGWFANAMQTGINHYERKKLQDKEPEVEHVIYRVDVGEGITRVDDVDEEDDEEEEDEETLEESFLEGFKEGRPD